MQLAAPEAVELPGLTFTVIHRCVWKGRRKCVASLGVLHSVHLRFSYCGTRDCMPSYHFPHKFTGRGGSDSACFLFSQIMLFLNDFFSICVVIFIICLLQVSGRRQWTSDWPQLLGSGALDRLRLSDWPMGTIYFIPDSALSPPPPIFI